MISDDAFERSCELMEQARALHREATEYTRWTIAMARRCRELGTFNDWDARDEIQRAESRVLADAALLEAQAYLLRSGEQNANVVVLST